MEDTRRQVGLQIMKVRLVLGIEKGGWQAVWMVDECNRHLHTEPVCTIPVGYGHRWFAEYLDGKELETLSAPLLEPCPPDA